MHTLKLLIACWIEFNFLFVLYRIWAGGLLEDENVEICQR